MLRAKVISQQNTQTENQNIVTICHIKKLKKLDKNRKYQSNPEYSAVQISKSDAILSKCMPPPFGQRTDARPYVDGYPSVEKVHFTTR